jgi:hypothetical protein
VRAVGAVNSETAASLGGRNTVPPKKAAPQSRKAGPARQRRATLAEWESVHGGPAGFDREPSPRSAASDEQRAAGAQTAATPPAGESGFQNAAGFQNTGGRFQANTPPAMPMGAGVSQPERLQSGENGRVAPPRATADTDSGAAGKFVNGERRVSRNAAVQAVRVIQ